MRTACVVLLLLLLEPTSYGYEEKDFECPHTSALVPTTTVCDGILDCTLPSNVSSGDGLSDESTDICAPAAFLDETVFQSREVTSTSMQLIWTKAATGVSNHSLKLAGYFLTGKSEPHSFQNTVSGRLHSYHVQWLKPWTHYTVILRPFYTESGKPHVSYKIGRAASVNVRTEAAAPVEPGLVSVLSAQQRRIVLNIIGPPTWNSDPVGFNVAWQAVNDGPHGELQVPLPPDWSPVENTLNATIPLPGGHDYRLSVSALGSDGADNDIWSPAVDVYVSLPLDYYEISAHVIGPSKAVISWRASEIVEVFKVTVYIDYGEGNLDFYSMREFEGTDTTSSRPTVLVTDLESWMCYMASLEGCLGKNCSAAVNTTFRTPPIVLPNPVLVRAVSTSSSSFELAWSFPKDDARLYNGFRVRYCRTSAASCLQVYTEKQELTVRGLDSGTTYDVDVRAQFTITGGRLMIGSPASASVTTWKDLPDIKVTDEATIPDHVGTYLLRWECVNSDVDYFQYKTAERTAWIWCTHSADCAVTVDKGRSTVFSSGYLRLTNPVTNFDFNLRVRGCNDHGCGEERSLSVNSYVPGPPPLSVVTITRSEHDATLRWSVPHPSAFNGVEVTWNCNGSTSIVHFAKINQILWNPFFSGQALLPGIPEDGEYCKASVSMYEDRDGDIYYGPVMPVILQ
ncbi:uncharacterized protein LOC142567910 [Dermacentor variabilis]|uniref:uncharacterized protein LOC142567910 n=1 Tax=Dermacentor variabilis TaxID=34621 RepID=UPI003F5B1DAA